MPSNVLDHELWNKAKAAAEKSGQSDNWAYISGIYQKMGGRYSGDIKKSDDDYEDYSIDTGYDEEDPYIDEDQDDEYKSLNAQIDDEELDELYEQDEYEDPDSFLSSDQYENDSEGIQEAPVIIVRFNLISAIRNLLDKIVPGKSVGDLKKAETTVHSYMRQGKQGMIPVMTHQRRVDVTPGPLFGGNQSPVQLNIFDQRQIPEEKKVDSTPVIPEKVPRKESKPRQKKLERSKGGDYSGKGIHSEAFKRWFGDWKNDPKNASKVVNKSGEPQETYETSGAVKVYHGTATGHFKEFDIEKIGRNNLFGKGFYFTEDREIASEYKFKGVKYDPEVIGNIIIPESSRMQLLRDIQDEIDKITVGDHRGHSASQIQTIVSATLLKKSTEFMKTGNLRDLTFDKKKNFLTDETELKPNSKLLEIVHEKLQDKYGIRMNPNEELIEAFLNIRKPFNLDDKADASIIQFIIDVADSKVKSEWGAFHYKHLMEYLPDFDNKELIDELIREGQLDPEHYERDRKRDYEYWKNEASASRKVPSYDKYYPPPPEGFTQPDAVNVMILHKHLMKSEDYRKKFKNRADNLDYQAVAWILADAGWSNSIDSFSEAIKNMGYDGMMHTGGWNVGTKDHKVWIAFEPNQIKSTSATEYDSGSNDIYKSMSRVSIIRNRILDLIKARVKGHYSRTKQGKMYHVSEHERNVPRQLNLFDTPTIPIQSRTVPVKPDIQEKPEEKPKTISGHTHQFDKPLHELGYDDLINVNMPKFPRSAYRGELIGPGGGYTANVYVQDGRVIVARPREFGRGEIDKRLPGTFAPNQFERAGGLQVSLERYVKFWRFKKDAENVSAEKKEPEVKIVKNNTVETAIAAVTQDDPKKAEKKAEKIKVEDIRLEDIEPVPLRSDGRIDQNLENERRTRFLNQYGIPKTHADRVFLNMKYMKATTTEWRALKPKGTALVTNDKGNKVLMPEFQFPTDYEKAPTLYPQTGNTSDNMNCELCLTPIKNPYYIVNDTKKWTMMVGSECVTNFEGKSGKDITKEQQWSENRNLVSELEAIERKLFNENRVSESIGYGRFQERWKNEESHDLYRRIRKVLGNVTSSKKNTSDAAISRLVNKNRESMYDLIHDYSQYLTGEYKTLSNRNWEYLQSLAPFVSREGREKLIKEHSFNKYKMDENMKRIDDDSYIAVLLDTALQTMGHHYGLPKGRGEYSQPDFKERLGKFKTTFQIKDE